MNALPQRSKSLLPAAPEAVPKNLSDFGTVAYIFVLSSIYIFIGTYPNKDSLLCAQQLVEHAMWSLKALIATPSTQSKVGRDERTA